jgi:predicted nucleic acid-binding protein
MSRALIDTNVLVYAHDGRNRVKQQRALDVLGGLHQRGAGLLSAQCLSEFFNVALRGRIPGLTPTLALNQLEALSRAFTIVPVSDAIVLEAARGALRFGMQLFDAQLWAAAKLSQVPLLLSEDFNVGARYEGVEIANPFIEDFDIDRWL